MGSPPDEHETDLGPGPASSDAETQSTEVFVGTELGRGGAEADSSQIISAEVHEHLFARAPVAARIGRFVVLEQIGRGGMGTVYAAYDEQLDRKVAVKVLRDKELPSAALRIRFRREAQALARLSHPNVVTIHEVGETEDDGLFLAMEFIRGQSLSSWFTTEPHWEEVLEVFVLAGRGLAASHAAGLVHRDLKPHNIMRSDEGVVKVLDFGLARAADDDEHDETESVSVTSSALSSSLTRTGAVMGTPTYMSPEQHEGATVDARGDQYSFCVALWEGLARSRPLSGRRASDLYRAKREGPPSWPSSAPPVPREIVKAVQRGLSPDPDDRWLSMDDLLAALTAEPERRRRWWLGLGLGLGLGGLGALALVANSSTTPEPSTKPCTGAADRLVGVWDEERAGGVESALLGLDTSYSAAVWTRAQQDLDAYTRGWVAMHTEACEATAVRHEQSARMLDLRMACLGRAAVELEAVVETLASADATVLENVHELTAGLPPLSECADVESLLAEVEPPRAEDATAVETARRHLARARSLSRAGRYDAARTAIEDAEATLADVAYDPVHTELLLAEGGVLRSLGERDAAAESWERALSLASRSAQLNSIFEAALNLMNMIGVQDQSADAMLYWPLVEGLSRGDPLREATARLTFAVVLEARGKLAEAEAELRTVLALRLEALGPDHPDVSITRHHLAAVLNNRGQSKEAEQLLRVTLEYDEAHFGPDHPELAAAVSNLGGILATQGHFEDAEVQLRTAVSILENAFGPEHISVARSRGSLGNILTQSEKYEEAEREYRASLAAFAATLGPEHPRAALHRVTFSQMLHATGRHREAEAEVRAARAAQLETLSPDHPHVLLATTILGSILSAQERLVEAEAELRAALEVMPQALGPAHSYTLAAKTYLAKVLLQLERSAEALEIAEQLQAQQTNPELTLLSRAKIDFLLGRTLWIVEGPARDRTRAVELATGALHKLREVGSSAASEIPEVERWLETHPRP